MDKEILITRTRKVLINFVELYKFFPEHHFFKNHYFAYIIYLLLALFGEHKIGFKSVLRILARLLKEGKISLETYRKIIFQLVIGGIRMVDINVI